MTESKCLCLCVSLWELQMDDRQLAMRLRVGDASRTFRGILVASGAVRKPVDLP